MTVSALLQFVVLPFLVPNIHGGDGLLKDSDSQTFHNFAVNYSTYLRDNGPRCWKLSPDPDTNLQPAALAAIVYYYTVPKPWVLIPINAFLHACAGLVLYLLIYRISRSNNSPFFAASCFISFPSAMAWYAQLHRDGIFILGCFFCLYGILLFLDEGGMESFSKKFSAFCIYILGVVMVYITRDYAIYLVFGTTIGWFGLLLIVYFWKNRKLLPSKVFFYVAAFLVVLIGMLLLIDWEKYSAPKDSAKHANWEYSPIVPDSAERVLQYVADRRQLFFAIHPDAGTNVDSDYQFNSVWKVLIYIPKAYCNVYIAPYPSMWFKDAVKVGGGLQRKVAAIEMFLSYIFFIGIPIALWAFWNRREVWLLLWYSLAMSLFLGLAVPNIGSLYRIRYGFFMIMLSLGVIGWAILIKRYKRESS